MPERKIDFTKDELSMLFRALNNEKTRLEIQVSIWKEKIKKIDDPRAKEVYETWIKSSQMDIKRITDFLDKHERPEDLFRFVYPTGHLSP